MIEEFSILTPQEDKETTSPFQKVIKNYIELITAQIDASPLLLKLLVSQTIANVKAVQKFIREHEIKEEKDGDSTTLTIPYALNSRFSQLNSCTHTSILATNLIPCNIVVSLVSLYDAYLGNLIKVMYKTCPDLLNDSNKNFSLSEILQFESIEEAKERVIEKEVDAVLRDSHLAQIQWIETKLKLPLRKDLPAFSDFIEITERRNLFVHTNGEVSRQYIKICKENQVKGIEKIKIGNHLTATPQYIFHCYNTLFEIGVKLGHVIWRKLDKTTRVQADNYLNDICFDLLKQNKYELALVLLKFATEVLKTHANQEIKYIFIINKALAYYLTDDKQACIEVLDKEDWSAFAPKFQLAVAVLHDDYATATSYMKMIKDSAPKNIYGDWPLFTKFRESDEFKSCYKELYNEDFSYAEIKGVDLEDILHEAHELQHALKQSESTSQDATNESEIS